MGGGEGGGGGGTICQVDRDARAAVLDLGDGRSKAKVSQASSCGLHDLPQTSPAHGAGFMLGLVQSFRRCSNLQQCHCQETCTAVDLVDGPWIVLTLTLDDCKHLGLLAQHSTTSRYKQMWILFERPSIPLLA